ncbi:MAG: uncharacterized protein K0R63_1596 [Rickettsiales bacterium]|jgi:ribosome maturation factor RimP|nr:uncharacterized protein [Rickettsiales bacterium]
MMQTPIEARISGIITPAIQSTGHEIVRVRYTGGGQRKTLQIMIERQDGTPVTVENCADVSHAVSAILDVEDPISDEYDLEVSSPGIDRPLVKLTDFDRFTGFETRINTAVAIEGQRKFKGRLRGTAENEAVLLELPPAGKFDEATTIRIPYADIESAKLVMSNELMALSAPKKIPADGNS